MEDKDFRVIKEAVQPDSRGRLTLGQVAKAKSYRVMVNKAVQKSHALGSFAQYADLEIDD